MINDEVVDEISAIREAHAAKFGYDLRAIYEDLKRTVAEPISAGRPFVSPPSPAASNSAFQRTRFAHR
jgi:hypothetical protein